MSDSGYGGAVASGNSSIDDSQSNKPSGDDIVTEKQKKLLEATKTGDLPEVKRLVEECHVKLDSCLEDNLHCDTPLHLAAFHGHLKVVKYLVKNNKCDVQCRNKFENTPLHRAARQGQLYVVKYLIEDGKSDPMCVCNWKRTPLHHTCKHGRLDVVKYLMEKVNVDAFATESRHGLTPLDLAAQYGALDVVQYMIEEKKCHEGQKEGSNTPLHQAAFGGRLEVVKYLIEKKVYDSMCKGKKGRTPLHSACKKNQLEVVKYYMDTLQVKFDSSCYDNDFHMNPLDVAAEHGALDVVRYMVEEKHCAVEHGNQNSVLHQAAYGGQLEVVQYLINKGHCDPKCRGRIGKTPLHSACQNGKNDVVDYLIGECNVDASTPDDLSNTPLHSAVKSGNKSVVELLVAKFDCDPEAVNHKERTPLEEALKMGHKHISTYLTSFKEIHSNEVRVSLKTHLKMPVTRAGPTGRELGSGSYGSVIELRTDKEIVAGKVFKVSETTTRGLMPKVDLIIKEIKTITNLQHPNIVASKGVCFLPDKIMPVLLMELLMSSLDAYLLHPDNYNLPVERKVSILHDIASGLDYLHSHTPAVIHRDLTAKNVLLDSDLRAKIADFGNSRIMDLDPDSSLGSLTSVPGTLVYMPPEAQGDEVTYDPSLDVFSFGHLSLFTIIQTPVRPLLPPNYHDSTGELHAQSEVMKRVQFVEAAEQLLSENQSLVALIKQCLHNIPAQRPHTRELLTRLQEMMTHDIHSPSHRLVVADSERDNSHIEMKNITTARDTDIHSPSHRVVVAVSETDKSHIEMKNITTARDTDPSSSQTKHARGEDLSPAPPAKQAKPNHYYFKENVSQLKTCLLPPVTKYAHFADALELAFVQPIKVVTLTHEREEVPIENEGISIHVPDDAVPVGQILNIEVGSAMYGNLSFPEDMRPVSPILWICPQEEMDLLKPFKITLPHTVKYEEGVTELFFLKACHNKELPMAMQEVFDFEEMTHHNGIEFNERDGSVYTKHFCCVCIAENVRRPSKKRYLLHRTQPRYRNSRVFAVDYCITFDLPHCVQTFKLFCENKELDVRCSWPEFTFDSDEVQLTPLPPTPGWTVDIQCEKTKITEDEIDFWKYDRERLGEFENQRRYPPKITLEFSEYQAVGPSKVDISFTGAVANTPLKDSIRLFPQESKQMIVSQSIHPPETSAIPTMELEIAADEERQTLNNFIMGVEQQISENQTIMAMIKQYLGTPSKHSGTGDMLKSLSQLTSRTAAELPPTKRPRTGDLWKPLPLLTPTPICETDIFMETAVEPPPSKRPRAENSWKPLPSRTQAPIRGADIVAETTVKLTPGEPLDFHWEGHGLKLYIPADALMPTTPAPEPITMTIRASINGQFLLPSDLELVSGIYWVSFSKRFSKPVTLSVQHCCNLEDPDQVSSLCFVAAKCTQEELPYNFKKITAKSSFSTKSCYGTIELKHFSGVAIGQEEKARQRWNKRYIVQVYSNTHVGGNKLIQNVHVPVIWDLELYRKVVQELYSKKDGPQISMKVNITSDELSLDIGKQPEGWVITPLVPLQLFREDIDNYNEGTEIPKFHMEFSWEGDGPPKTLRHKISMSGVQHVDSFFYITIHPNLHSPSPSPALSLPPVFLEASPSPSAAHPEQNEDVQPETEACLDINDLFAVCEELQPVAANWEGIGSALGLPPDVIETIKSDCKDVDEHLKATIKVWLKKTYDTGEPSWKKLVQAVSHPCGGKDHALAQKIAKNHGVPSEDIRRSST